MSKKQICKNCGSEIKDKYIPDYHCNYDDSEGVREFIEKLCYLEKTTKKQFCEKHEISMKGAQHIILDKICKAMGLELKYCVRLP